MNNSELIRTSRYLLIIAIAAVVFELPIATAWVEGRSVLFSPGEIEDQPDNEDNGESSQKLDMFAGINSTAPFVSVFFVVLGESSPLNHHGDFLVGHLERGPPSSA